MNRKLILAVFALIAVALVVFVSFEYEVYPGPVRMISASDVNSAVPRVGWNETHSSTHLSPMSFPPANRTRMTKETFQPSNGTQAQKSSWEINITVFEFENARYPGMYFQNYSRHQWNVSVGQEVISEGNIHYNYSVIGNSTTAHIFSETSAYFLDYYILINTAPMNGYVLSRGQSVNLLNSEVALINLSDPYL